MDNRARPCAVICCVLLALSALALPEVGSARTLYVSANNLGTGETSLTLERVTITYTRLAAEPSGLPESRGSTLGGNEAGRPKGHCVMLVAQGRGGINRARTTENAFSNCGGDGLFMYYAPFLAAPGESQKLSLQIDRSTISSDKGYSLRWANYGAVHHALVKVRDSFIVGARDKVAVARMQNPAVTKVDAGSFDFGTAGAPGGNCIELASGRAVELVGVEADFAGNFWDANGVSSPMDNQILPLIETISFNQAKIKADAPITVAPSTCGGM
jgi:hypothetical protein